MPYLIDKGSAVGIDISDRIVQFARERGIVNCFVGDVFRYKFNTTYDTITLVGNDIALSGTIYNLRKLLKRLYALLNQGGQVLAIIRHIRTLKYWHVVYIPEYEGQLGPPLKCLFINTNYFVKLSQKHGFSPEIIGNNKQKEYLLYLIRLVKN